MFDLDWRVLEALRDHPVGFLDSLSHTSYQLDQSSTARLVAVLAVAAVIALRRSWWALAAGTLAFVAADGLIGLLKDGLAVRRPPASLAIEPAIGFAMPSTHAGFTAAVAVAVVLGVRWASPWQRRLAAGAGVAITATIGLLMVYAGVHWLTDVLAGWAIGVAVGVAAHLAVAQVQRRLSPAAR